MKLKVEVEWNGEIYYLVKGKYAFNGNTSLSLVDKKEGTIYAVATINLGHSICEEFVYIKDYSENVGMLNALIKAGVIKEIVRWIPQGFVRLPMCQIDLELWEDKDV